MLTALLDGTEKWEAREVARLPDDQVDALRPRWICTGCENKAYYAGRSRNGRPPLFGSHYHADDCPEQTTSGKTEEAGWETEVEPISNDASRLILRLDRPEEHRTQRRARPGANEQVARRHTATGSGQSTHDQSHRLAPLLNRLRDDPAFREDTRPFSLGSGIWTTIRDICLHAEEFTEEDLGHQVIVWGTVFSAKFSAKGNWINSGPMRRHMPAIRLSDRNLTTVLDKAHVEDAEDLADWSFIAVGTFKPTSLASPYVTPQAHEVAFLTPK